MLEGHPAVPFNPPKNGNQPDIAKCPVCEYRAGPFTSTRAAAADYLKHLQDRHAKMMSQCECGWTSGPHQGQFDGLAALVAHAGEAHQIAWRPPTLPKWNEAYYRGALERAMTAAKKIENGTEGKLVTAPGEPPYDAAAHLVRIGHELLIGVSVAIDLMLEARTGQPHIVQKQPKAQTNAEQKS